ncbi:hypothetical protein HDU83_006587 [Entophlyctis luteolus]|nr:hypothetical protein HDU83_006587 [Entophlyctis luteolus]
MAPAVRRDVYSVANPFTAWPILGEDWQIGPKDMVAYPHGKGPGYGCFVNPSLPVGVALSTNTAIACPPGFYCPFVNASDPDTTPVMCPPDTYCTMIRLLGNRCMVCTLLIVCAFYLLKQHRTCPAAGQFSPGEWGHFYAAAADMPPLPRAAARQDTTGSTAPSRCGLFSYCPAGAIAEASYGMIVLFVAIDVVLFASLFAHKAYEMRKQGIHSITLRSIFKRIAAGKSSRGSSGSNTGTSATVFRLSKTSAHKPTQQLSRGSESATIGSGAGAAVDDAPPTASPPDATPLSPPLSPPSRRPTQFLLSLTHLGTTPPHILNVEPSYLDIDYPDVAAAKCDAESPRGSSDDGAEMSEIEVRRLELCSVVSNVSPMLEAFRLAFRGVESLRMTLKFNGLRFCLGDKVVLDGVSGEIKSGRMTAILGPSGCGKTTFVNVLMGKIARTGGELLINGVPAEMHTFRKIIGYVPQDDVMLRELTVREVIHYSARTRLPRDWTVKQVDELVDAILRVLNLEHIANTMIGDEFSRGISGGQRKRVNIAMELAAAPLTLILDEPTSGLDATSSLKVAKILRSISRVGLTVVSIIHQPRIEIFNTFDDVLMLVPGGRTAYFGPVARARAYFEDFLGCTFDHDANPADVMMDILSGRGRVKCADAPMGSVALKADALARRWSSGGMDFVKVDDTEGAGGGARSALGIPAISPGGAPDTGTNDLFSVDSMRAVAQARGASFLRQVWNAHQRSLLQQSRTIGGLFMELWVGLLAGLIMGIAGKCDEMYHGVLISPFASLSSTPNEWFLGLYGTLIGVAVAVAGGPAGVRLFGEEKSVYWREVASGHNSLAYYLGKNISAIYRVALSSLHFTGIYVFFAKPSYPLEYEYALIFLNFFCIYGVSIVVSMMVRRENASLMSVITGLFFAVFDGFAPTLAQAAETNTQYLYTLSPNRWAAEAQYGLALQIYRGLYNVDIAANYFGYEIYQMQRNMGMMVALAMGYRVLGYVLMVCRHRDKQR